MSTEFSIEPAVPTYDFDEMRVVLDVFESDEATVPTDDLDFTETRLSFDPTRHTLLAQTDKFSTSLRSVKVSSIDIMEYKILS